MTKNARKLADRTTEIVITPEMVEAGKRVLYDYHPAFSNENAIVMAIFREMLKAAH